MRDYKLNYVNFDLIILPFKTHDKFQQKTSQIPRQKSNLTNMNL